MCCAGLMLATYWAARYFVPAGLSLWMAKQARKHWDSVSATVVMAASYAASMAVSHRLLAGSTSTIKLHYPLFSGYVTIPRVVAKWIRHHNGLAKLLTKTVSIIRSCLKSESSLCFHTFNVAESFAQFLSDSGCPACSWLLVPGSCCHWLQHCNWLFGWMPKDATAK